MTNIPTVTVGPEPYTNPARVLVTSTMAPFYPKKWYIVPHDENPATTTLPSGQVVKSLPLGQLISSVDEISHSLNRKTLIAPEPEDIKDTLQTSSKIELFKNHALHASLKVSGTGTPASGEAGRGADGNDKMTLDIDVVQTQVLSPTDDYAKDNFNASREETEMKNYLNKKKLGLKVPVGSKMVLMITARKIGKALTIMRDDASGFDAKVKTGLDVHPGMNVEASLDADWKKGLKIGVFTEEPCVFAVQVRKVNYHADPQKAVTTMQFVKSAVWGDSEDEDEHDGDGESSTTNVSNYQLDTTLAELSSRE